MRYIKKHHGIIVVDQTPLFHLCLGYKLTVEKTCLEPSGTCWVRCLIYSGGDRGNRINKAEALWDSG